MPVTLVEGADATPVTGTILETAASTTGEVPGVRIGYLDGSNVFQVLGDENGVSIQGTASLTDIGSSSASRTTVGDTATSTTLIAANASRMGFNIKNTSTANLRVAFGGTASATNEVITLGENERVSDAGIGVYQGDITGVWASDAGGVAVCTEW